MVNQTILSVSLFVLLWSGSTSLENVTAELERLEREPQQVDAISGAACK
jgi:hypothetical protein